MIQICIKKWHISLRIYEQWVYSFSTIKGDLILIQKLLFIFPIQHITIKQKASIFFKCKVSVGMLFLTFVTKRLSCDFLWYMNQLMHLCIYSRIISSKLFPAYVTFLANAQKHFGHLAVSSQWQLAVFYGIPYNRHFTLEKNWNILCCCYKYMEKIN